MIDNQYLEKKNIQQIRKSFHLQKELPSVTLHSFLEKDSYEQLQKKILKLPFQHQHQWASHSYSAASLTPETEKTLQAVAEFIHNLLPQKHSSAPFHASLFTWKDYTILSDESREKPGTDIILDLTDDWQDGAGGAMVYRIKEDNYVIPVRGNSLTIVQRKSSAQRFVQYVNHYGEGKKRVFLLKRCKS